MILNETEKKVIKASTLLARSSSYLITALEAQAVSSIYIPRVLELIHDALRELNVE